MAAADTDKWRRGPVDPGVAMSGYFAVVIFVALIVSPFIVPVSSTC